MKTSEREGHMRSLLAAALLLCFCLDASASAAAPQTDAARRARELAASFNKSKHEIKEKRGVRMEKFKEVRSEPAPRQNPADYSGTYEASIGLDYTLSLKVAADGSAEGSGYDPDPTGPRAFTLTNARVVGALLTGTKTYADGSTEKFEGVFINRTERDSPSAAAITEFGLGVVFDPRKIVEGLDLERLFYRPRR
jgi:hypothetical protein